MNHSAASLLSSSITSDARWRWTVSIRILPSISISLLIQDRLSLLMTISFYLHDILSLYYQTPLLRPFTKEDRSWHQENQPVYPIKMPILPSPLAASSEWVRFFNPSETRSWCTTIQHYPNLSGFDIINCLNCTTEYGSYGKTTKREYIYDYLGSTQIYWVYKK